MFWAHASTVTHHMTTAKTTPHPLSRFLNLFGCEEFAGFQFHLESLILHLVLKVSQFLLFDPRWPWGHRWDWSREIEAQLSWLQGLP